MAFGQVRSWLASCDKHHRDCQQLRQQRGSAAAAMMPTRVLRVDGSSMKVYLVDTLPEQTGRYIALSHRWGKSHRLTLTHGNHLALRGGISIAEIPQTFQDAIAVCRSLGVAYLWIDSLCILQDDAADWENEASRMGSVYLNAYLTLAALHSEDDASGCFPSAARNADKMPFPFVSPDVVCTGRPAITNTIPLVELGDVYECAAVFAMVGEGKKRYYLTHEWMPPSTESHKQRYGTFNFGASYDPLAAEPLSSRGWVLQERLLAPRTLHYSEGQMYWECQQCVLGEDGSMLERRFPRLQALEETRQRAMRLAADPSGDHAGEDEEPSARDEWLRLVEIFTTRELTMSSDKLVALAGLARLVGESSTVKTGRDEYVAGIWRSNFVRGLCWKRKVVAATHSCHDEQHTQALPDATAASITRVAEYRAPSWSWAAVDGEIDFKDLWLGPGRKGVVAEVLEVCVEPLGRDIFGRVKSGTASIMVGTHQPNTSSHSSCVPCVSANKTSWRRLSLAIFSCHTMSLPRKIYGGSTSRPRLFRQNLVHPRRRGSSLMRNRTHLVLPPS